MNENTKADTERKGKKEKKSAPSKRARAPAVDVGELARKLGGRASGCRRCADSPAQRGGPWLPPSNRGNGRVVLLRGSGAGSDEHDDVEDEGI